MRPTLYEFAGGDDAFLALASAHHARRLADPELGHPFSHADLNPELPTDPSFLQRLHAGNGEMTDLGRRFVECFVAAADDAGLPADPRFRAALGAYMEWAVDDVLAYSAVEAVVPAGLPIPRWSWDGLQPT